MDMNELVTVYTVSNSVDAEMVKNALDDEGIESFVEGGNQAGESGLTGIEIRIQVPARDAERARRFLVAHDQQRKARQGSDVA